LKPFGDSFLNVEGHAQSRVNVWPKIGCCLRCAQDHWLLGGDKVGIAIGEIIAGASLGQYRHGVFIVMYISR